MRRTLVLLVILMGLLIVSPLAGVLSDRIGRRPVLVVGMVLQGVGLAWIATIATAGATYGEFVVPLIIAGIGISMAMPVTSTAVMSAVAPHDMGKASGVNSTLQRFGAAFAISIAAAVFTANGHLGTPSTFTAGFRPALGVVAGLSLLGGLTAIALSGRHREPAVAEVDLVAATA